MLRLLIALFLLALLAMAIWGVMKEARHWLEPGGADDAKTLGSGMQKVSFVLLLLLIVYVAIVGAG